MLDPKGFRNLSGFFDWTAPDFKTKTRFLGVISPDIFTKTPMAVANNYTIFEPLSFR